MVGVSVSHPPRALVPRQMGHWKFWRSCSGCEHHRDCQREPHGCGGVGMGFWQSSGTSSLTLNNIWWPWPSQSLLEERCCEREAALGTVIPLLFCLLSGATRSLATVGFLFEASLKLYQKRVVFLQTLPGGESIKGIALKLEDLDSNSGFVTVVWDSAYSSVEWDK